MPRKLPIRPPQPIRVEKFVPGGDGFARLPDGRVAFIPGAIPGDTVLPEALESKRDFVRVSRFKLLESSSERRIAPCVYAVDCGGCDWMSLPEAAQADAKVALLKEALRRTAGLTDLPCAVEFVASPRSLAYRSRVRLHVSRQGVGFFSASSRRLVPVPTCNVATEQVNQGLAALQALVKSDSRALSTVGEVDVRALAEQLEFVFHLKQGAGLPSHAERERLAAALTAFTAASHLKLAAPTFAFVDAEGRPLKGADTSLQAAQRVAHVADTSLQIAAGSFTQVNWDVNQSLVGDLLKLLPTINAHTFYDLYCGNGNFSLPLLKYGLRGTGVESNPTSIALARSAARAQALPDDFIVDDVSNAVQKWSSQGKQADLVVVDPPRGGVGEAAPYVAQLASKYLYLCACDPVPLARDLKHYLQAGFELMSVRIYDMFPQTHHFETVLQLKRKNVDSPSPLASTN